MRLATVQFLARRRRPRATPAPALHPGIPAAVATARNLQRAAYQDGLGDGIEIVLLELEGRGHRSYTGALPAELAEWIAQTRRRVKEERAARHDRAPS